MPVCVSVRVYIYGRSWTDRAGRKEGERGRAQSDKVMMAQSPIRKAKKRQLRTAANDKMSEHGRNLTKHNHPPAENTHTHTQPHSHIATLPGKEASAPSASSFEPYFFRDFFGLAAEFSPSSAPACCISSSIDLSRSSTRAPISSSRPMMFVDISSNRDCICWRRP